MTLIQNPRIQCPCAWLFEILEHLGAQMAFRCLCSSKRWAFFSHVLRAWLHQEDARCEVEVREVPHFFLGSIQKTDRQIFPFFCASGNSSDLSMMWILWSTTPTGLALHSKFPTTEWMQSKNLIIKKIHRTREKTLPPHPHPRKILPKK